MTNSNRWLPPGSGQPEDDSTIPPGDSSGAQQQESSGIRWQAPANETPAEPPYETFQPHSEPGVPQSKQVRASGRTTGKGKKIAVPLVAALAMIMVTAAATWFLTDSSPSQTLSANEFSIADQNRSEEPTAGSDTNSADNNSGDTPAQVTTTVTAENSSQPSATRSSGNTPAGANSAPTNPACDGRGVIIYASVYGPNPGPEINQELANHPGTVYASPGACASLRPEVEGYPVYAIYRDFGHDLDAMCAADTGASTNSRIMQDRAVYGDYCGI